MIDPHRDFAEEARREAPSGPFARLMGPGGFRLRIEPNMLDPRGVCARMFSHRGEIGGFSFDVSLLRPFAVDLVRFADKLDPAGAIVKGEPASAWKRADMIRPPDSGTILARNVPGDVFVVWRSSYACHWCEGDSVFPRSFIEWTEVPR